MKRKIIVSLGIALILVIGIRVAFGINATSQISKDNYLFEFKSSAANITTKFDVIIAKNVKTHYYGGEVNGTMEKAASVYYYDGKIIINDVKAFRKILIKDNDEIIKRQITSSADTEVNIYKTLPRFFDDINNPDQLIKESIELPIVIYILNPLNMIEEQYYIDKNLEYRRVNTYERK
ncbi:MAG: hypothetical protein U9Q80_11840 [Bacillota bacterium]|nr:hypothetical protein [Bacillota bacterium]